MKEQYNRILKGLHELNPNPFMDSVRRCINEWPETIDIFADALSIGQVQSKKWLIEELLNTNRSLGVVYLIGGWYGTLAYLIMQENLEIERLISIDIDDSCLDVAQRLNLENTNKWKFKAITENAYKLNYGRFKKDEFDFFSKTRNEIVKVTTEPQTVINTSCEHFGNFSDWYNKLADGTFLILQSNNFFEVDDHVNCRLDITDFKNSAPMTTLLYEGTLKLEKYDRFMLIGYK